MKKYLSFLICMLTLLLVRNDAHAHLPGQPPFFKINGTFTDFYHITGTSLDDFSLPQDKAPKQYQINETIHFSIDRTQLPVPAEIVEKTTFVWDYGDGGRGKGLANDYAYKKQGSFILSVYADTSAFEKGVEPQLIQSVLLNIVPSESYTLPKAVFTVNGKSVSDSVGEWLTFPPETKLMFDATNSSVPSGSTYLWDFGDGKSATGKTTTYTYRDQVLVFPILRIQTPDGFIADSFVEIHNSIDETSGVNSQMNDGDTQNQTGIINRILWGVVALAIVVCGIVFLQRKKK
jgi:hypothetical protein